MEQAVLGIVFIHVVSGIVKQHFNIKQIIVKVENIIFIVNTLAILDFNVSNLVQKTQMLKHKIQEVCELLFTEVLTLHLVTYY